MLIVLVSLWEVPNGAHWAVVAPSPDNRSSCVLVHVFIRPLPDISNHIHYAKRTSSIWICIYVTSRKHHPPPIGNPSGSIFGVKPPVARGRRNSAGRRYTHRRTRIGRSCRSRRRHARRRNGRRCDCPWCWRKPIAISPRVKPIVIALGGVLPFHS